MPGSTGPPFAGRGKNRPDNVVVAGTPAEVTLQGGPDLVLGGRRVLREQRDAGHHHARGTEPALQAVLGVEGPAWMLYDFDERWDNPVLRADVMDVARRLEAEPSILGASAHLLGIGRKT